MASGVTVAKEVIRGQGFSFYSSVSVNMALFRGVRAVGKTVVTAVDSGIIAPAASYHKNVSSYTADILMFCTKQGVNCLRFVIYDLRSDC